MLTLEKVTKVFAGHKALDSVDLNLLEGQTTILLGPSGCGKSTLLRILLGLLVPDEGRVCLRGEDLRTQSGPQMRRGFGYGIQDGGLFPHLTARENICLIAHHLNWDPKRTAARLALLCELTHFPQKSLAQYPTQLSGGQRSRVGLMRALFLDPPILLMDEPLAALDPIIRRELQEDMCSIFSHLKKTTVWVTHDLAEAAFLGNQIVMLRHGRILQMGTLQDLINHPVDPFVTRYIDAQRYAIGAMERKQP